MQFPESWLREYCNPPISMAELAELLTMAGMEVEETRPVAPPFTRVVVGVVQAVRRHPNADRLSVCSVDAGAGELLEIVCGAPNVKSGIKVPCALVGAELPPPEGASEPLRIRLGQLRGVESQGMLCSARELGLSDDHSGLLILDETAAVGRDVREELRLDDTIFTLKLTPNLAHGMSVYGVARELAALTGAPLRVPAFEPVAPTQDARLAVRIEAPDLCGRFSGRVVSGIDPLAVTPRWMVDRLERCGQRPVSPLVDISNYVMFEFGRPTHIFDLDKIHGGLAVRWGRPGESLELLNGNTVELDETVGVIADRQAVESLAGIMGGAATAVSDATRNVYVEAAFWWPEAVAGRSRRFNFTTDAGQRFERGVDPATTVEHLEYITRLITEICGNSATRCGPVDDQQPNMPQSAPVVLRVERAAKVIGMPVTQSQCEAVMQRLGLPYTAEPGRLTVTPPSWRFDLKVEEDLIEEVIRIVGYESLPDAAPRAALRARVRSESRRSVDALRHTMAALGYRETINFSFVEERWEQDLAGNAAPIRVLNPIASSLAVMRSSLIGSLIGTLRFNLARKAPRARLFELGRVFLRDASVADGPASVAGVHQPLRLAGLAYGAAEALQWGVKERAVDFFDIKGDIEILLEPMPARFVAATHPALHPGRCAAIELDGTRIGIAGELHPKWRQAYELPHAPVLFELDLQAVLERDVPQAHPVPRHPAALRDIAVVAGDAVSHEALMQTIASVEGGLVRSARLFDVYRPPGDAGAAERSLAVRLEILDDEATLTDERIDAAVAAVVAALEEQLGLKLRH
jgi:phenylalanyl-tRNA synthetase beta chain